MQGYSTVLGVALERKIARACKDESEYKYTKYNPMAWGRSRLETKLC